MSVVSIQIDNKKRKALKALANKEGKTMGGIVSDLIETFISENKEKINLPIEKDNIQEITKLSENSFSEWDNEEDEIYDTL